MSDIADASATPAMNGSSNPQTEPRGGANQSRQRGRDGQGRGRGGRGRGGPRGDTRGGRGGRHHDGAPPSNPPSLNHRQSAPRPPRSIPPKSPEQNNQENSPQTHEPTSTAPPTDDEDAEDGEVCFICASPVVHQSLAPCNHRTCHICSLRMRALYKSRACAHCRQEAKYVVFTDDNIKHFEEFQSTDFDSTDDVLGIKYDQKEIREDTILLLRYNCPDSTCDVACFGWPDLHRHVRSVHHKVMCDLCTRNKKVFTHEHELFTQQELKKHERSGDDNPGSVDQSGFKGHPLCGFCNQRFYGDDELYAHLRDKHEKCHVCERMNPGKPPQYYLNYEELAKHFRKDHFMCPDNECLEKKFVVFGSEMDLKAHQLEQHPDGLSKDARRDARRVDIASFDYRQPHQAEQPRRRGGRGRDPNTEPLPVSSAQPMRRDEIAFARQMAIQSAQSVTTRNFGGALTSTDAYAARPSTSSEPTSQAAPRAGAPPPQTTLPIREAPAQSQTQSILPPTNDPRELARRMQHQSVMDRSLALLKNNESKFSDFRSQISSFRNGTVSAEQLIDVFFSLFDVPSADLGKLIKELADIFEIESKRADLLKAWSDWRAINEDYPVLPGPSGTLPTHAPTNVIGRRILKLKSSTSQSAAAAPLGNKPASWTAVANPHVSRGVPGHFPSLPIGAAARSANVGSVPWAGSTASRPVSTPKSSTRPAPSGSEAFPALPAAMKLNTLMAGIHRGTVRWDDSRGRPAPANPWGASASEQEDVVDGQESQAANGKKKGRKGKQVLYAFG